MRNGDASDASRFIGLGKRNTDWPVDNADLATVECTAEGSPRELLDIEVETHFR